MKLGLLILDTPDQDPDFSFGMVLRIQRFIVRIWLRLINNVTRVQIPVGKFSHLSSGLNVLVISFAKNNTYTPLSGYTQMIFSDGTQYVAYSALGVGHTVPVRDNDVVAWFDITGTTITTTGAGA